MPKLKTNEKNLVKIAVQGKIAAAYQWAPFEVAHDGRPFALPSTGGITYNVKVGDLAGGWEGDHVEPGVSAVWDEEKRSSKQNSGFNFLACCGNSARVVSGGAKGARGTVIGHHGGVEHVIIDFDDRALGRMTLDDKILIEAFGQGIKLVDYPDVTLYSIDPGLLGKIGLKPSRGGGLTVPVTTIVPAEVMGSGIGALNVGTGDYDIMTHDPKTVRKHGIDKIRLGDLIAIMDHDNRYGRTFRPGAVSIGVVIHADSLLAGHGPGVSTIMTCERPALKPVRDPNANVGRILGIGRYRGKR